MKKIIAMLLAIVMTLSVFAVPVSAQEITGAGTTVTGEVAEETEKSDTQRYSEVDDVVYTVTTMMNALFELIKVFHQFMGDIYALFGKPCPLCNKTHKIDGVSSEFNVAFELNYDGAPEAEKITVKTGKKITAPAEPVRDGYTFKGWFTEKECKTEFDFTDAIEKDCTLYAKWEESVIEGNVTVTLNLNYDGAPEAEKIAAEAGKKITAPAVPVREEYTFKGWFTESVCLNKFDFDTIINRDIVLYAKWTADTPLKDFAADTDTLSVGAEEEILFTVTAAEDVTAVEIYMNGEMLGDMNDDGENGDIKAGDGIFSYTCTVTPDAETEYVFRAASGEFKSEEIRLRSYDIPTVEEIERLDEVRKALNEIEAAFMGEDGTVPGDKTAECMAKLAEYANGLKEAGIATECYQSNGTTLVITLNSGLPIVYAINSGNTFSSGKTLNIMSQIKSYISEEDGRIEANRLLAKSENEMTKLGDSVTWTKDEEVKLDSFEKMGENQVILWSGHGVRTRSCTYLETQESYDTIRYWITDPIYYTELTFIQNKMCMTADGNIAVNHKYLNKKLPRLDNSFVYLLSCNSGDDANLCNAFIKKGATSLVAVHKSIKSRYGLVMQAVLAFALTQINPATNNFYTVDEAMNLCLNHYGNDDGNGAYPFVYPGGSLRGSYRIADAETGTLSGKICKASDRVTAIGGAAVDINRNGDDFKELNADTHGNYSVDLAEGRYYIEITADGYIPFRSYADVIPNENTYMETFLLVDGDPEDIGTAKGKVFNSLTGYGEDGVTLTVKKDWNNTDASAETVKTVTTDSNGEYTVDLNLGNYTVIAEKDGFNSGSFNIVVREGTTSNQNGTITPISDPSISSNDFLFTLTWGMNPRDLDSHVEGTLSNGNKFHVYYPTSSKIQRDNGEIICELDYDDTDGEGPEHVTLKANSSKTYYYYIHLYAGTGTIATSGAKIRVERGGEFVRDFNVPSNIGTDRYWNVFAIKDGKIIVKNTMTSSPDTSYAD